MTGEVICQRCDWGGGGIVLINDRVVELFSKCLFLYSKICVVFNADQKSFFFEGEIVNAETYNCSNG